MAKKGKAQWDAARVALAKGMVYVHFGFPIATGMDVSTQTGSQLGAAHLAGSLNHIGAVWLSHVTQGAYIFGPILTGHDVYKVTPAGELMRLCYGHIVKLPQQQVMGPQTFIGSKSAAKFHKIFEAADLTSILPTDEALLANPTGDEDDE